MRKVLYRWFIKQGFEKEVTGETQIEAISLHLGAFGGMAGMICLTGATMNGHLAHTHFFVGMATLTVIVLGCVWYINHNTEGGEWVE